MVTDNAELKHDEACTLAINVNTDVSYVPLGAFSFILSRASRPSAVGSI